jgi:ABC-type multidrug transport system fused ATPase/permease subunit
MQKDIYDKIISFLLGASWAIVFFGALVTFKTFLVLGVALSIFLTLTFIFFSLFLILTLDFFMTNKKKFEEMKKQTELLEKIEQKMESVTDIKA